MKLFVLEEHSEDVRGRAAASTRLLVSQLTWAEMCAGMSLKLRTSQIDAQQAQLALEQLGLEWPRYSRSGVDEDLIVDAGELALRFGLRAYDSVQLASARRVHRQLGDSLLFCCFDRALNSAAVALNMATLPQAA